MKTNFKLLVLILGFFSAQPLSFGQEAVRGQWDGNVDLNAGTNFVKDMSSRKYSHSLGAFSAWGRYRTDKFNIRLDLQCLSEFAATSVSGSTVNVKDLNAPQVSLDVNHNEGSIIDGRAGVLMEYTPDERNSLLFNFKQRLNRQTPDRVILSMQNFFSGDDYKDIKTRTYLDIEDVLQNVAEYNVLAKWNHKFDKVGREIDSGIEWMLNRTDKSSTWYRMSGDAIPDDAMEDSAFYGDLSEREDEMIMSERIFRITPLDIKNNLYASVRYRDSDMFNLEGLNLELGADLRMEFEGDNLSAANYVNEVWVDSLGYRRNFDFFTMDLCPGAKLSYSPGKFNISLQLSPDFYVSKLGSEGDRGRFNFGKVYLLPDFNASWTPSPMHKVGVTYKQGLVRPSYLQVCWFPRIGAYANEVQVGNPDLKPSGNGRASLFYTFHSGFFTGTLEGIGKVSWDRMDKVFNNGGEYRIYNWINSGHSFDNSVKLTLKAELKNFDAELGGYYNYFVGYNNDGAATRSSDWGLNGNATLRIKGGWSFNVKGRYQSKIIRTYSSITEYVGCDFRVKKDFRRFNVYVEGRDLFDRPINITTYSEDKTYARFEEHYYNRRIFSVGASFKF